MAVTPSSYSNYSVAKLLYKESVMAPSPSRFYI